MKTKFERRLVMPIFPEMEAEIQLAGQQHMTTPADYCRRALADRFAKDGYMSSRPHSEPHRMPTIRLMPAAASPLSQDHRCG